MKFLYDRTCVGFFNGQDWWFLIPSHLEVPVREVVDDEVLDKIKEEVHEEV